MKEMHLRRTFMDMIDGYFPVDPARFNSEFLVEHREEQRHGKTVKVASLKPCYKRNWYDKLNGVHYLPIGIANDLRERHPGSYNFGIAMRDNRDGERPVLVATAKLSLQSLF